MQSPIIRAKQHLLVQGFTLLTIEAAVCIRLIDPSVLESYGQWAILSGTESMKWATILHDDDPLKVPLIELATKDKDPHVLCGIRGKIAIFPLQVTDVRSAKLRIQAAIDNDTAVSTERLTAIPDELLRQEAMRRFKQDFSPQD